MHSTILGRNTPSTSGNFAQVASGLVPPAVAYHLFGKGGVILITIMVFMAGEHLLISLSV